MTNSIKLPFSLCSGSTLPKDFNEEQSIILFNLIQNSLNHHFDGVSSYKLVLNKSIKLENEFLEDEDDYIDDVVFNLYKIEETKMDKAWINLYCSKDSEPSFFITLATGQMLSVPFFLHDSPELVDRLVFDSKKNDNFNKSIFEKQLKVKNDIAAKKIKDYTRKLNKFSDDLLGLIQENTSPKLNRK